jgi:hypothetical protein
MGFIHERGVRVIRRMQRRWASRGIRAAHQVTRDRLLSAIAGEQRPESCLFFTIHKCASTFVNRLLPVLSEGSGYELHDYETVIWKLGDQINVESAYQPLFERHYDQLFRLRGEVYGPQRKPLDFPGRDRFKHIFFLRDPRDVLVSAYYSFGFSHALPVNTGAREKFQHVREEIRTEGIDAYALRASDEWVLGVYQGYQRIRETAPRNMFLTYDEFRLDTGSFIDRIADFLEIRLPSDRRAKLVSAASPVRKQEDIHSHRRSGKSGQYLKALKPETVEALNEKFAEVLEYWGDGVWLEGEIKRSQ